MGLGQTELFEPAASRRVLRRTGDCWCGVDPSTKRCAIVVMGAGRRDVRTVSFPARDGGALRLAAIYDGVRGLYRQMGLDVGVVVVEQPSGKQANPALGYAVGVTVAAIASLYDGEWSEREPPLVTMVPSSKWKLKACGHGGIRKPKPTSREEYGVLTWARAHGYDGSSWDEADALGIAEYARRTYAIERR